MSDEDTQRRLDTLASGIEAARSAAAAARAENMVLASLLGHIVARWSATTGDPNATLGQIADITLGSAQEAARNKPDDPVAQAGVKMASRLVLQMKTVLGITLDADAERRADPAPGQP